MMGRGTQYVLFAGCCGRSVSFGLIVAALQSEVEMVELSSGGQCAAHKEGSHKWLGVAVECGAVTRL